MQAIAVIGCGAIGEAVADLLADRHDVEIAVALVRPGTDARAREVFGDTVVELIADPAATCNIHEIVAEGDFGRF